MHCLVFESVVQVVWTKSLQTMHRTVLVFFVVVDALRAGGTHVNFSWSRVALNISSKCDEEYDCQHVMSPLMKKCVLYSTNRTFPRALKQSTECAAPGRRTWSRRRCGAIWHDSATAASGVRANPPRRGTPDRCVRAGGSAGWPTSTLQTGPACFSVLLFCVGCAEGMIFVMVW